MRMWFTHKIPDFNYTYAHIVPGSKRSNRATANGITLTRVSLYETALAHIRKSEDASDVLFSKNLFFIQIKVRNSKSGKRKSISSTDMRCRTIVLPEDTWSRVSTGSVVSQPATQRNSYFRSKGTKLYGVAAAKWRPGRGNFRTRIVVFRYVGIQANRGHSTVFRSQNKNFNFLQRRRHVQNWRSIFSHFVPE